MSDVEEFLKRGMEATATGMQEAYDRGELVGYINSDDFKRMILTEIRKRLELRKQQIDLESRKGYESLVAVEWSDIDSVLNELETGKKEAPEADRDR